jgi:hypothetical protein
MFLKMSSYILHVEGVTAPLAGPGGRARKVVAALAAALVMSCSLYAGFRSSLAECNIVFHDAPRNAIPPRLVAQAEIIKKIVPKGSYLFYLTDKPEAWRFGLWKRYFFLEYVLLPPVDAKQFDSLQLRTFRKLHNVRYAILVGSSFSAVRGRTTLPSNEDGTPMGLAELEE